MNYAQLKKLDKETLEKLTEGKGPSDECLCSILAPPEDEAGPTKGIKSSLKRMFASMGPSRAKKQFTGRNTVDIPLTFTQGGNGIYTIKEAVKRKTPCGKCGCDHENIVMKHSYANIRITSPDVSSICPCPTDCLPDKAKLSNNIKVTIERVSIRDIDAVDSEHTIYTSDDELDEPEPTMERRSISELIDHVYLSD